MHLISNRQRQEAIDFLTSFIELTADNGSNRVRNLKRRAGLLIKRLKESKELSNELAKAIKKDNGAGVA